MQYAVFDLVAVALPAVLLLAGSRSRRALLVPVGVLAAVAVVWTAPWDEHLVRTGVWTYAPDRVLASLGSVPLEEYAFVVLEVLLVGAWALRTGALPVPPVRPAPAASRRGALAWFVVALAGLLLTVLGGQLRYLGLLLLWAGPPLALQRLVAGDVLAARRATRLHIALPAALWLCVADRLALANGVWSIAPQSSTGLALLGLPVEEALFFSLTCLLVTDGLLLAADPAVLRRALPVLSSCRAVVTSRRGAPAALAAGRVAATTAARTVGG